MKWFNNMRIAAKLILGFLIVAIIAGVVGGVGLVNINKIADADTQLFGRNALGLDYSGNASVLYQRIRFNVVKMMVVDDISEVNNAVDNINNYSSEVNKYLDLYNNLDISDENRALFNEIGPKWDEYASLAQDYIRLIQLGQVEEAKELNFGPMVRVGDSLREGFNAVMEYNTNAAKARADNNMELAKTSSIMMISVIAVAVIIAILLGIFISRMISNPVKEMVEAADILAQGDINVDIKTDAKDEVGRLAEAFRGMIANIHNQVKVAESIADGDLTVNVEVRSDRDLLNMKFKEIVDKNNEVMNNIVIAADQVAAGSQQVSDSSMALSQGAAEQASSVEELTASLEEVSSQTDVNAKNANDANALAEGAKEGAMKGNEKMQEALVAMEEINESSSNISKIIKVIDEIAFQTNILALNAAVEAARAGQHGKGFAVVAEEVRNLAARSADAAKETTEMIEGSIKKAEAGTRIANETAEALNKIVEDVAKAANLIGDIALASNEQASAIGQINQGIMQVSQVVQSNSATSEESAAASEELSGQADLLQEMVGRFKLKNIGKSYRKQEELDLEEIKMIEEAAKEKKNKESNGDNKKAKIVLSDKEFGKY